MAEATKVPEQQVVKDYHWYVLHGEEDLAALKDEEFRTGTLLAEMTGDETFDFGAEDSEEEEMGK